MRSPKPIDELFRFAKGEWLKIEFECSKIIENFIFFRHVNAVIKAKGRYIKY